MKIANTTLAILCMLSLQLSGCIAKSEDFVSSAHSNQSTVSDNPNFLFQDKNRSYYVNESDKTICRIDANDKEASVILNYQSVLEHDEQHISYLSVVDELLFFRTTFNLYRYDLKTQDLAEIYYDARSVGITGNDIYFLGREATVYKMNIHDTQPTAILESEISGNDKYQWKNLYKNFIFVDDVMYYYKRNPDGLYQFENDVSTLIDSNTKINEFSLVEHNGNLCYIAIDGETAEVFEYNPKDKTINSLVKCNDYKENAVIKDGYFCYIDLHDNKLKKQI